MEISQKTAATARSESFYSNNHPKVLLFLDLRRAVPDADQQTYCREARTGEYDWIREYQYEVSNTRDVGINATYLLQFENGQCKYLDLNTRMRCNKRTRGAQGADPRTEFPRPSKVAPKYQPDFPASPENFTLQKNQSLLSIDCSSSLPMYSMAM